VIFAICFVVESAYLVKMDDKWFKQRQKIAGVTADEIALKMGRDRSIVSRIYTGRQKMTVEWAKAFAKVLNVSLDDVLLHAGVLDAPEARTIKPGLSDGDAAPWVGKGGEAQRIDAIATVFGGGKPGIDVWQVQSAAMTLNGLIAGDFLLVDSHQSETCRAGDVVIAQIYDWQTGSATSVIRRYEPPVLVAASTAPEDQRVLVVDGNNVVIKGKVIANWRA